MKKKVIIICITPIFSQSYIQSEYSYKYYYDTYYTNDVLSLFEDAGSIGWQKEYLPSIYQDSSYTSQYSNSLYYQVLAMLDDTDDSLDLLTDSNTNSLSISDNTFEPVVLTGDANISVTYKYGSHIKLNVVATTQTLIQLPLIYYNGYSITITDSNNQSYTISPYNPEEIDYFVGFGISEGEYSVSVNYTGTSIQKASKVVFIVSFTSLFIFVVFDYCYNKKKKN